MTTVMETLVDSDVSIAPIYIPLSEPVSVSQSLSVIASVTAEGTK